MNGHLMGSQAPGVLEETLAGLEAGLHVRHIATPNPRSCDVADLAAEVLNRPEHLDFDAIAVRKRGHVVGMLERSTDEMTGTAGEHMRPLDDSILVSADLAIAKLSAQSGSSHPASLSRIQESMRS